MKIFLSGSKLSFQERGFSTKRGSQNWMVLWMHLGSFGKSGGMRGAGAEASEPLSCLPSPEGSNGHPHAHSYPGCSQLFVLLPRIPQGSKVQKQQNPWFVKKRKKKKMDKISFTCQLNI